jgi:hypothetical protein
MARQIVNLRDIRKVRFDSAEPMIDDRLDNMRSTASWASLVANVRRKL